MSIGRAYTQPMHRLLGIALLALLIGACGGEDIDISQIPELPEISEAELLVLLADSTEPIVPVSLPLSSAT